MNCLRDLLVNAIDYAGLFPPAGLGMEAAAKNYAAYRSGPDRWALGRFIVPVARLAELESAAASLLTPGEPWPLSVLGGADLAADLRAIASFRDRRRDARIASLELKASSPAEVAKAAEQIKGSVETFFEIPLADASIPLLDAIHGARARAKIRTGGTQAGSIPPADQVARFLELANQRVAFKATAGLHHPVRCVRPLTYEASSPKELMHGFVNVFLAAAFVRNGGAGKDLRELLEEQEPASFKVGASEVSWRNHKVARKELAQTHVDFILSFGSCSFDEPIRELKEIGFL